MATTPLSEMTMSKLTLEEQLVWDYIEQESNDLVLEIQAKIAIDGYTKATPNEESAPETLALKVMSLAMIKTLAILTEKRGHPNMAMAYMQIVPMHVAMVQELTIKQMRGEMI